MATAAYHVPAPAVERQNVQYAQRERVRPAQRTTGVHTPPPQGDERVGPAMRAYHRPVPGGTPPSVAAAATPPRTGGGGQCASPSPMHSAHGSSPASYYSPLPPEGPTPASAKVAFAETVDYVPPSLQSADASAATVTRMPSEDIHHGAARLGACPSAGYDYPAHPTVAAYCEMQGDLRVRVAAHQRREEGMRELRDEARHLREELTALHAKRSRVYESTAAARALLTPEEQAALAPPYRNGAPYTSRQAQGLSKDIDTLQGTQRALQKAQDRHRANVRAEQASAHAAQQRQLQHMYARPAEQPGVVHQDSAHARALRCQARVNAVADNFAALLSAKAGPAPVQPSEKTKSVRFAGSS
eukprot:TRINITY_DN20067_c0_g2_i1.p1 TRINITY_DN20067_c0_g2~~TRINITY_DN20067_c0_g2_i1.p1  ORF type:complete len:378 (+),score=64.69 TRINITY_DN20067_c0_g2_i1:62-1135(+)